MALNNDGDSCDYCEFVRKTCQEYCETEECQGLVKIDKTALTPLANSIREQHKGEDGGKSNNKIQWDEEGWHYNPCDDNLFSPAIRQERIALYILALDAINFCFWPAATHHVYEYDDLATTMTKMAESDHKQQQLELEQQQQQRNDGDFDSSKSAAVLLSPEYVFTATNLANMTVDKMQQLFVKFHPRGLEPPPNLEQRCGLWNEIGNVLLDKFRGSAMQLITQARNKSAPQLVKILVDNFQGFRDYVDIEDDKNDDDKNDRIWFLKRAQICVGDWNASLQLELRHMDQLTTFADYRVPQLLRHHQVLVYAQSLADKVDKQQELIMKCREELAIRSCTVTAVELLVQILNKDAGGGGWNAVQVDWYLWQVGERLQKKGQLSPHHRVRTIYY